MDGQTGFDGGFDGVEKRTEVVRVVTRDGLGEYLSGADVERRDDFGDAMTLIQKQCARISKLRRWLRPDPLILDDFAMREFAAGQAEDIYEPITDIAAKSIVIASNRKLEDWYPLFPNPVAAVSIVARLANIAHQIHMEGRSYRPNKRPARTTTTTAS